MFPLRLIFFLFFIGTSFEEVHTTILQVLQAYIASHVTELLQTWVHSNKYVTSGSSYEDADLCKWQSVKCVFLQALLSLFHVAGVAADLRDSLFRGPRKAVI